MTDQPARLDMLSPLGTTHMVLERDRADFEARGYRVFAPPPPDLGDAPEMTLDDVWALMEAEAPEDSGLPEATDEDAPDPATPPPAGAAKPTKPARTRKPASAPLGQAAASS